MKATAEKLKLTNELLTLCEIIAEKQALNHKEDKTRDELLTAWLGRNPTKKRPTNEERVKEIWPLEVLQERRERDSLLSECYKDLKSRFETITGKEVKQNWLMLYWTIEKIIQKQKK